MRLVMSFVSADGASGTLTEELSVLTFVACSLAPPGQVLQQHLHPTARRGVQPQLTEEPCGSGMDAG